MTKTLTASLSGITLHVKDIEKSLEFYSGIPGARVIVPIQGNGEQRFAMVRVGNGCIGLLSGVPQLKFHLELESSDLDDMYKNLVRLGYKPEGPPEDRPWGQRDMRLIDPDGYMVEFDQGDLIAYETLKSRINSRLRAAFRPTQPGIV